MAEPNDVETLCNSGVLYSPEFIKTFGSSGPHWGSDTWLQREASLRHDMVCLLLCNLEVDESLRPLDLEEDLNPPPLKRRRYDESEASTSSSSASDRGVSSRELPRDPDVVAEVKGDEDVYRYLLLEGRSNVAQLQHKICTALGIEPMRRQYDIYDKAERKFIEVKVTLNYRASRDEFDYYMDPDQYIALVHLHPVSADCRTKGKRDPMPGLGKAKQFLLERASKMGAQFNHMESDLVTSKDLVKSIFVCERFNKNVADWTKLFWDHKDNAAVGYEKIMNAEKVDWVLEKDLKGFIEDTSKRDAEFMKFPGKVLPDPLVHHVMTQLDKDSEMISLLFEDLQFAATEEKSHVLNWIVNKWQSSEGNTFCLSTIKDRTGMPIELQRDLGIGCKGTVRDDGNVNLKQKEFKPIQPARYSAWMSNLLKELSEPNKLGMNFFLELQQQEMQDDHPMNVIIEPIANKYFNLFGHSTIGSYCSKLKSVYSRFSGAYSGKFTSSKDRPDAVVFPIYSVGEKDGETWRALSGFIIRGPQHARSATDKIPIITVEMLNGDDGVRYRKFIKNAHVVRDTRGRAWCYRVNSVMKGALSYVTFVINSSYLPANMLGELTLNNPHNRTDYNAGLAMETYLLEHGEWLMERCAESVMMAAIGGSQEEGAMAIIRKIFMMKLEWSRGQKVIGCDVKGLADALNECLINSPFALYMGKQLRDSLVG
uniref:Polymerase PA n=1 Tax=Guadeloupe mosquito quaranja-like virus 1 TaxID=2607737 RepID=A0A894KMH9_9ORTO|nr:MAG: polymerase PA [Guadeloupe mosquito quaranja-like virus 1]QRW42582.1 MAG: polymerase PA [Guadeloupe mosquito quaranja-like virus 1]QRW42583.1 MAG: polymerase PA [Guadeloupe mosquito quaranja-like virus 1]QRW42584.1 MAG: polymerase PA [Guadeloupe mosquito quaranja-like virus 1]QRW42585.1 MAG: polymerase PA [Guadeloupe mosquito quaranja-like virus 1]